MQKGVHMQHPLRMLQQGTKEVKQKVGVWGQIQNDFSISPTACEVKFLHTRALC